MNWENLKNDALQLAHELDPDPDHALQVCNLSLELFDQLALIHQLEDTPDMELTHRQLLQLAAWLHDIGWSISGSGGHHKKSRNRILDSQLDISPWSKNLVAQIARYHRKKHPDPMRHFMFAELNADDQNRVCWLSAILRIGDGLDRAHTSDVDHLSVEYDALTITIKLSCNTGKATAVYGANRKKELLEEISQRSIRIL